MLKYLKQRNSSKLPLGAPEQIKTYVKGKSDISVGRFTYGYEHAHVYQWDEGADLTIGHYCSIAGGLKVYMGGNHRMDWATTYPFGLLFQKELGEFDIPDKAVSNGDITIGSDVWIGSNVTIMSGTTIGHGAVIAANATVAGRVEPYQIAGGNPARPIRWRFEDEIRAKLLEMAWWDQPVEIVRRIAPMLSTPPTLDVLARIENVMTQG
ncbi:MAG: CatB-related O-acetyltransferase [Roseovarius sp.]